MKILMVNPPFMYNDTDWITVPPQGYGGIQWIIKNLMDGLVQLGCDIKLIGAPGSSSSEHLEVIHIGKPSQISEYLHDNANEFIVHDHSSRGVEFTDPIDFSACTKIIHSHYLTSKPQYTNNVVAASHAHASVIGLPHAPVVRHPVNPDNYIYSDNKSDYLLFMGRVSVWKGTHLAAHFAKKAGMRLKIVGPAWEPDYFRYIMDKYGDVVEYCGEMGGYEKKEMLAKATATLVFSGGIHTPTSLNWVEPGSQIVSESGISGTPVISSSNGCLKEIVPHIGTVVESVESITSKEAERILSQLPDSAAVRDASNAEWNYKKIAGEYIGLYRRIEKGDTW